MLRIETNNEIGPAMCIGLVVGYLLGSAFGMFIADKEKYSKPQIVHGVK